jgi:hypothetical protein
MLDDETKKAKAAIVAEVISAAAANPNVKAAAGELGQSALTISKAVNTLLLPVAAVNFAFEKARRYFAAEFAADMQAKAASIPADKVIEPKASVVGPALQGLAFAHEEPDLKQMYLSLLATAMDGRATGLAHPAFADMIRQLSCDEAPMLFVVLRLVGGVGIAEIRLKDEAPQWSVLHRNLLHLTKAATGEIVEDARVPAFIDNWVRLGLVQIDFSKQQAEPNAYEWVEQRPEYLKLKSAHEDKTRKVTYERGFLEPTSLGRIFATAVGIT